MSSRVGSLPLYADVRFHIPLTHRNDVIRYMLDSRVDALHEVLNISDNEVFDNEGKKMNTGIMKSRSSKQLRSKNQ